MATITARQRTLADGRTVTWVRKPIEAIDGRVLCYVNTEGSVDGRCITDDRLHRLVDLDDLVSSRR
ncbi:MAG: hypothetical protein ACYC2O_06490 [Microthrixaceae bacterium]